jgi:hypothetical protein
VAGRRNGALYSIAVKDTGLAALTAVYRNELADLRWKAFDSVGNSIKGMHISVAPDRSVVADGQTPLHLKLPPGSYSITATALPSSRYYEFARWDDGSKGAHQGSLAQDARITAYYGSVIAGQLEAFARCQDYQRHVAVSMLRGGPLIGLLELQMRNNVMTSAGCALL